MIRTSISREHFALFGVGEIHAVAKDNMRWMRHQEGIQGGNGARRTEEFLRLVSTGDESLVAQSEEMLAKIEDQIPVSQGWRNVDDVVGALPIIPSFLAGHPQHMRRRERADRENAPITIFMDLTSSMGIPQQKILKRGIVLLALTRLLVEHRSVELWVGTSLGGSSPSGKDSCIVGWQIDTAPMDLARAAFHISDVSMSRLFGYATCEMLVDRHLGGFGADKERNVKMLQQVGGWHELMYIPPIHHADPMTDDPVSWIKRVMKQYTGQGEDA